MDYNTFLERVINEGIEAAKEDYKDDPQKRDGSVEGFEACRGLRPHELYELLQDSGKAQQKAFREQSNDYWRIRCRQAEIEWVCNVVSAMLANSGLTPIITPTARGVQKAASIVGVA